MISRFLPLLILAPVMIAGCGEAGTPTGQVKGAITYNGGPLKEGTITFIPKGGRPGYGKIVDGQIIEVTTNATKDGAPLGENQVTIQSVQTGADMYAPQKSVIPEHYGNPEKSGLTAKIVAGQNEVKFDLK